MVTLWPAATCDRRQVCRRLSSGPCQNVTTSGSMRVKTLASRRALTATVVSLMYRQPPTRFASRIDLSPMGRGEHSYEETDFANSRLAQERRDQAQARSALALTS